MGVHDMRVPPPIFAACALLAAAGAPPAVRAGEPFQIRNDQPVGRLYGVPVGVEADPAAALTQPRDVRAAIAHHGPGQGHGPDAALPLARSWRFEERRGRVALASIHVVPAHVTPRQVFRHTT